MRSGTLVKFSVKVMNDNIQGVLSYFIWLQIFFTRQRQHILLTVNPNTQTVNSVILYHC